MGTVNDTVVLQTGLTAGCAATGIASFQLPPLPGPDLVAYAMRLRAHAEDFAPGTPIQVPRERLLALLGIVTGGGGQPQVHDSTGQDLRVPDLAQRLRRKNSTVRQMCKDGEFDMPRPGDGAYKHRGKEWMVPLAAVEAYKARQRMGGRTAVDKLSDWKQVKSPKRRRAHAQTREPNLLA
jgi:hypothetical protein